MKQLYFLNAFLLAAVLTACTGKSMEIPSQTAAATVTTAVVEESLPETQSETQPESQPESQPEAQPEAQPETQPKTQPESKPKTQPETQLQSQPQPVAQGIGTGTGTEPERVPEAGSGEGIENEEETMRISVQGNGHTVVFELNDSPASKSLYNQLPLTIEVENYGGNEKIFYPPVRLEIGDTQLTKGGGEGGLAYFASWGDVIMYYGDFSSYSGLYDLGTAISGREWIEELSGEIVIEGVKMSL